jgi:hypothetical protein
MVTYPRSVLGVTLIQFLNTQAYKNSSQPEPTQLLTSTGNKEGEEKKRMTKGYENAQSNVRQGEDNTNNYYGHKSS